MKDLEKVKENLEKRGYSVSVFPTAAECARYLDRCIDKTSVGIGGSVTVEQLGVFPMLKAHNAVYWHNDPEQVDKFGMQGVQKMAADTDVYISSVNAMSECGRIINIDFRGNRLASTIFGHRKVYLIAGENKIAPDFERAMYRARNVAAPKNAKRLGRKTPCAVNGDRCYDCNSPDRICRGFLTLEMAVAGVETEVLLVREELGF